MRSFFTFLCLLISLQVCAQTSNESLTGSWIKTQVVLKNGEQLSDDKQLKSEYVKYVFSKPNNLSICFDFRDKGTKMTYDLKNNIIEIKNSYGYLTNSFLIEKSSADKLVLLQKGQESFESPDCIRYYFIKEIAFQQTNPLNSNDILSVKGIDTIYKASIKMYAVYKGDNSFHDYLTSNIPEFKAVQTTNGHLIATYVVNKLGVADSLHILEGINPLFDKQFIKAFNKVKKNWQPATLNYRNITIQMTEEFRFISGGNFLPSYDYSRKGNDAMHQGQFDQAIYYFDKALEKYPENLDNLYHRAVCKIALGNKTGACEDLNYIKRMGSIMADALIEKNCK